MQNKMITYILSMIVSLAFIAPAANAADADPRKTYAVSWVIETNNSDLFNKTIVPHANEVLELWKDGVVENVYLDTEVSHSIIKKGDIARVMFFIKAKTEAEANSILDELPLVKSKAATFKLTQVGTLWLPQY